MRCLKARREGDLKGRPLDHSPSRTLNLCPLLAASMLVSHAGGQNSQPSKDTKTASRSKLFRWTGSSVWCGKSRHRCGFRPDRFSSYNRPTTTAISKRSAPDKNCHSSPPDCKSRAPHRAAVLVWSHNNEGVVGVTCRKKSPKKLALTDFRATLFIGT